MNKLVYVPFWMRESVDPLVRGFPKNINIIVFDCETDEGIPYLITFYDGNEVTYKWINRNEKIKIDLTRDWRKIRGTKKGEIVKTDKTEYINTSKAIEIFIEYLKTHIKKKGVNVIWAHNLEFDIGAIMDEILLQLYEYNHNEPAKWTKVDDNGDTFQIELKGRQQMWGKIRLGNIDKKKTHFILLTDTYNFIPGSLYKISRDLNLTHSKPARPQHINEGRRPKNKLEREATQRYCRPEILATYDLAQWIIDFHREYDVPISVSMAHLGSEILRKRFMIRPIQQVPQNNKKLYIYQDDKGFFVYSLEPNLPKHTKVMTTQKVYNKDTDDSDELIVQKYILQLGVMRLAERCIHAGRSSTFVGKNVIMKNVNVYDYNSFYPWGMTQLPPLDKGTWEEVNEFVDEYEGFYEVTGTVKYCKYPIILPYPGKFKFAGEFEDERIVRAPLTSYEVREALRAKELEIDKIRGYIWIPDEDATNPLKDYVEHFWNKRYESKDNPTKYVGYKLLMNALYGKMYATIPFPEYINDYDAIWNVNLGKSIPKIKRRKAGSCYLPHIASWILGLTKAKLHQDLHKYNCLTCSTDSIMTRQHIESSNKLGELKLVYHNNVPLENCLVLFLRPKLYAIFSSIVQKEVEEIEELLQLDPHSALRLWLKKALKLKSNQPAIKCATHGFRGNWRNLLEMYMLKTNEYDYDHFIRIREGIVQSKKEQIRTVQRLTAHVNVDWDKPTFPCGLTKEQALKEKELCQFPQCRSCPHVEW